MADGLGQAFVRYKTDSAEGTAIGITFNPKITPEFGGMSLKVGQTTNVCTCTAAHAEQWIKTPNRRARPRGAAWHQ